MRDSYFSCDVAPLDMDLAIHSLNKYGISPKLDDGDRARPDQGDGFRWPKSKQYAISCPSGAGSELTTAPIRYRRWGHNPNCCCDPRSESHPQAPAQAQSKESFRYSFCFSFLRFRLTFPSGAPARWKVSCLQPLSKRSRLISISCCYACLKGPFVMTAIIHLVKCVCCSVAHIPCTMCTGDENRTPNPAVR